MTKQPELLVTGSRGFIGRVVQRELEAAGRAWTRLEWRRWTDPSGPTDADRELVGRGRGLLHLAWSTPQRSHWQPHARQVEALARLLDEPGLKLERVIALGSAEEYGDCSGCLRESDAPESGLTPYGWGKQSARRLLADWSRRTGGTVLWLQPFLVYGEGQEGEMVIPYALRKARAGTTAAFSAGTQIRDFIHVEDVARAIVLALSASLTGFHAVNLGTGVGTPVRTVLSDIARAFGVLDLFEFGARPLRPGEPAEQVAATERARQLLGFAATIDLEAGLARLCAAAEKEAL